MGACRLQFAAQLQIIVNLTVEHQRVLPHQKWLVGAFAGVQNAQTTVAQDDVLLVRPNPFGIGSAVGNGGHHVTHPSGGVSQAVECLQSVDPCNATHRFSSLLLRCFSGRPIPALEAGLRGHFW